MQYSNLKRKVLHLKKSVIFHSETRRMRKVISRPMKGMETKLLNNTVSNVEGWERFATNLYHAVLSTLL